MQFAGQRTDMDLNPIGEPHNIFIKMTDDVLPEPDAVLITGITPQKTIAEGMSEAAFLKIFHEEIATEGTIFTGYNTVRFDDEFMRFLHYRNFYDPYEWQWKDDRSRWDLLDLVRMTRALRPEGMAWPFDSNGKPTNRLELLTELNGLDHAHAHDALSDVKASIAVARLIKNKQPKLFSYLLSMRDKHRVAELVNAEQPFVYVSGKYAGEYEKAAVVVKIGENEGNQGALVYDLREDPAAFDTMSEKELLACWQRRSDDPGLRLPVKTIKFNRCPAIAPLGTLDSESQKRLAIDPKNVQEHLKKLQVSQLGVKLEKLVKKLNTARAEQQSMLENEQAVDAQLYAGFFTAEDKPKMSMVRAADMSTLTQDDVSFKDRRLAALLPLYKARNYPDSLTELEREEWESFRKQRLLGGGQQSRLLRYGKRLQELAEKERDPAKQYLLEELTLYGQSIAPELPE